MLYAARKIGAECTLPIDSDARMSFGVKITAFFCFFIIKIDFCSRFRLKCVLFFEKKLSKMLE